ncbi:MAG: transglutaminase domain-containing protein [Gammaproteobacteria bacterium]|nr:transglutaminase domain-containing protein [Gammaproteobacteria bacterium]
MSLIITGAITMHNGIRGAHLAVKAKTEQWIAQWIARRSDPMKTHTALGQVGQLKLSDAIDFRIEPLSGKPDFPPLLREAAYNSASGTDWEVFDLRFHPVEHADDFRWEFAEGPQSQYPEAKIYIEFDRKRSPVPVPAELTEIYELPATAVNKSVYGTIQGTGLIPAPHYRVRYEIQGNLGDSPTSYDLLVPKEYDAYLSSIAPQDLSAHEALQFTQSFFQNFKYTLYQSGAEVQATPLTHFMSTKKAGHCEYFASATALLLRKLGVPTRYVVGYAVQEWNEGLGMYIVRKRHAHAWTIAYIDDRWIVVDTTPSSWLAMEESHANWLQPVSDFFGNNWFLFTRWWNDQELEDYERELYIFGAILALILIWRISTSERVTLEGEASGDVASWVLPGRESPFFRIEEQLSEMGYRRSRGELMTNWLLRIERPELLPLLTNHNRWRFDPHGISITERKQLAAQVQDWLTLNPSTEEA